MSRGDRPVTRLRPVLTVELEAKEPYSFERTVRKRTRFGADWYWITPYEFYHGGAIWSVMTLSNDRLVAVKLKASRPGVERRISAHLFSNERLSHTEGREAMGVLRRCLGLDHDVLGFYRMAEEYPVLRKAVQDLYGMRAAPLPDFFSAALLAVSLQRASYGRSGKMIRSLYEMYGTAVAFDGKQVITRPTAKRLLSAGDVEIRRVCGLGYRAAYVVGITKAVLEGRAPSLEQLQEMGVEEAKEALMGLKGIGEYSAEVISPYPSFPVDAWSIKIFAKCFSLKVPGSGARLMRAIKEFARGRFGQWQSYAYEYILNDLHRLSREFHFDF